MRQAASGDEAGTTTSASRREWRAFRGVAEGGVTSWPRGEKDAPEGGGVEWRSRAVPVSDGLNDLLLRRLPDSPQHSTPLSLSITHARSTPALAPLADEVKDDGGDDDHDTAHIGCRGTAVPCSCVTVRFR